MSTNEAEADRGRLQELLSCERGPTSIVVNLNKSGKKVKKCCSKKPTVKKKRDGVLRLFQLIVKTKTPEVNSSIKAAVITKVKEETEANPST
jgi:hypothetical protein